MAGPMDGVKVVELGIWVAGPAAAGILAEWGADVTKIEPTKGDPSRIFQFMLGGDMPTNPVFEMDNRSKRGMAVDLSQDKGKEILFDLLENADVFITNLRPGGLQRLGVDFESIEERFPRLIYCHITAYGREGESADLPSFDVGAFWARSGIASLLSTEDSDPPFQRGGMGDHSAAMSAAAAISAALFEREKSSKGQLVETSLIRQGAYTISFDLNALLMWGRTIALGSREGMGNPAMNNYKASCGRRFWLVGIEPFRHWPPLARAVGHPEWIEDERFSDPAARAKNAKELISELDKIFATRTLNEWSEIFSSEPDLFWAPVNTPDDLLADQTFNDSGALLDVPDGSTGTLMISTPVDFHRTPAAPRSLAPKLGEHTEAILKELGRSNEEILEMEKTGIVISSDENKLS